MLFIVVREIEASRLHMTIFSTLDEAQSCYRNAEYVCDNGPDEGPEDDPTVVTNCWLYEAATTDPVIARAMTGDGRATLLDFYG